MIDKRKKAAYLEAEKKRLLKEKGHRLHESRALQVSGVILILGGLFVSLHQLTMDTYTILSVSASAILILGGLISMNLATLKKAKILNEIYAPVKIKAELTSETAYISGSELVLQGVRAGRADSLSFSLDGIWHIAATDNEISFLYRQPGTCASSLFTTADYYEPSIASLLRESLPASRWNRLGAEKGGGN